MSAEELPTVRAVRRRGPVEAATGVSGAWLERIAREAGADDVAAAIDGGLWVEVLQGRRWPLWLVLTGRMRIKGDRRVLDTFQSCFPGSVEARCTGR